ncbi:MAG: hypothetical protein R6W70_09670 [bacterium]
MKVFVFMLFFIITTIACEDKSKNREESSEKDTKQSDISAPEKESQNKEKCDIFMPPWGDEYWESWGKENPREFELWYGSIVPKMKKVTVEDIKKCGHLENIFVGFSKIEDLSVFSEMKHLKKLDMRFAVNIKDVSPLSGLKNLEYLNIWKTAVKDFSPLKNLSSLKRFDAKMTPVTDVSPLAEIKTLEAVDFLQTDVSDVSSLSKLSNLKELVLCSTKVKDISMFYPMAEQFTYLDLCNTEFRDFEKLKLFSNLRRLKLWGLPIKDASLFSEMKDLWELDLWNTKITDISPLYGLENLERLVLKELDVPEKQVKKIKKKIPGIKVETEAQ